MTNPMDTPKKATNPAKSARPAGTLTHIAKEVQRQTGKYTFDQLIERVTPWLRATFRNKDLPRNLPAEDLIQETLLRVFRNFDKFRDEDGSHLRPWISEIARNVAAEFGRKKSARANASIGEEDGDVAEPAASGSGPGTVIADRDYGQRVRDLIGKCLDDLTEVQQQVWRRSVLLGMSHVQIAEELAIKEPTVRSHFRRANLQLSKAVTKLGLNL